MQMDIFCDELGICLLTYIRNALNCRSSFEGASVSTPFTGLKLYVAFLINTKVNY